MLTLIAELQLIQTEVHESSYECSFVQIHWRVLSKNAHIVFKRGIYYSQSHTSDISTPPVSPLSMYSDLRNLTAAKTRTTDSPVIIATVRKWIYKKKNKKKQKKNKNKNKKTYINRMNNVRIK